MPRYDWVAVERLIKDGGARSWANEDDFAEAIRQMRAKGLGVAAIAKHFHANMHAIRKHLEVGK